jgi:hypothetical protein
MPKSLPSPKRLRAGRQISKEFQMPNFKNKQNLNEEYHDLKFDIELISFELWTLSFGIVLMGFRPILS